MARPKKLPRYNVCILQDMPQYGLEMLDVIEAEEYWVGAKNISKSRGIYIGSDVTRPSWHPVLMEGQYQFVGT